MDEVHMPRNVISKNEGVSPVIGTILLVALTVVLVGIIGAVLMGFGMPEPAPILGISIGNQGNIITVAHLNGAELPAGSYKILVDGVDKTAEFGGDVDFSPGITLSWDSGSEAVGTVSVVYTSDKGVSTLLAEKRIGKAGSGGGFEDKYTIIHRVNWQTFLDEVNASSGGLSLGHGIVYVDNGEYWVSINYQYMSKADAATDPSIQEYVDRYSDNRLIEIDLSKKIYNSSDINPADFSDPWKSAPYPTMGSLYEYAGALYMDVIIASNPWNPTRDPDTTNWVKIAYIK